MVVKNIRILTKLMVIRNSCNLAVILKDFHTFYPFLYVYVTSAKHRQPVTNHASISGNGNRNEMSERNIIVQGQLLVLFSKISGI